MKNFRSSPEVNAGSMADIAFLLLIFFLVSTTIPKDKGIARIMPRKCPPSQPCETDIKERNVLVISANAVGELFVNNDLLEYKNLQETVIKFIDNNGDGNCDYCKGTQELNASVHPNLAAILIDVQATAPYRYYITIQDEITKGYDVLRRRYAKEVFDKNLDQLTKVQLKQVKEAYPYRISEAEVK